MSLPTNSNPLDVVNSVVGAPDEEKGFKKVVVEGGVVDMNGDEMTRVIWKWIRSKLVFPFVEFQNRIPMDLGLANRLKTDNEVTRWAADNTRAVGVAVKCATITPDHARYIEYGLVPKGTDTNYTWPPKFYPDASQSVEVQARALLRLARIWSDADDVDYTGFKNGERTSSLLAVVDWLYPELAQNAELKAEVDKQAGADGSGSNDELNKYQKAEFDAFAAVAGANRLLFKSPNGFIRNRLGGTIFRTPILMSNVPRLVPGWKLPITIGRHAYADQYKATEVVVPGAGKVFLTYVPEGADEPTVQLQVHEFTAPGASIAMFNTEDSVRKFAHASFKQGLDRGCDVYLSTKNTILKKYDGMFMNIFQQVFDETYKPAFDAYNAKVRAHNEANPDQRLNEIGYWHRLIDDMVAFVLKNQGGFVWACKNYDGDVQSDTLGQGFGSLGLMTSVLVSPQETTVKQVEAPEPKVVAEEESSEFNPPPPSFSDEKVSEIVYEAEAAHGTVQRHFYQWEKGFATSTNPIASIYAWVEGLKKRANFDSSPEVYYYALALADATTKAVEKDNCLTKDLGLLLTNKVTVSEAAPTDKKEDADGKLICYSTDVFLNCVRSHLSANMANMDAWLTANNLQRKVA